MLSTTGSWVKRRRHGEVDEAARPLHKIDRLLLDFSPSAGTKERGS